MNVAVVNASVEEISSKLDVTGCVSAGPVSGSFACFACSHLVRKRGVFFITAHQDDADESVAMLRDLGVVAEHFPALESEIAKELVATRFAVLEQLSTSDSPRVIVASIAAVMQMTPTQGTIPTVVRRIKRGDQCSMRALQQWLIEGGYERREAIEESAQFATRGGVLDIATAAGDFVRLDFFGDTIETISEVDPVSLGSDLAIDEIIIAAAKRVGVDGTIVDHLPDSWCAVLDDVEEISQQAKSYGTIAKRFA